MSKNTPKGIAKATGELALKMGLYLPAKMVRTFIAYDAIMKYGTKEYFATVEEYNKLLLEGKDQREKDFWSKIHTRLANDDRFRIDAEERAEREIQTLRDLGQEIPPNLKAQRVIEIIEEQRDQEILDYARYKSNKATLTNAPEGVISGVYKVSKAVTGIKKEDELPVILMKMFAKSVLPIIRVPSNHINMWADYTVLGGVIRGARGKRTMSEDNRRMRPDERIEHYAKAAIGMATFTYAFNAMFQWGDEEDEKNNVPLFERSIKVRKDAPIEVTANGFDKYRGFADNKSIAKDYQEWSIRFKNPLTGDFTEWMRYTDHPLGFQLASLGYMSDALKFVDKKDKNETKKMSEKAMFMLEYGYMKPLFMVLDQNYVQNVSSFLELFDQRGNIGDKSKKLFLRPVKATLYPNLYNQSSQFVDAMVGTPKQKSAKFKDDLVLGMKHAIFKDLPIIDEWIDNPQFDQLGYPITDEFNIPYTPDFIWRPLENIAAEKKKHPEWEIIYKYPEVTIGDWIRSPKTLTDNFGRKRELTYDQRKAYDKKAAKVLRKNIRLEMNMLENMGPTFLQRRLDEIKRKSRTETNLIMRNTVLLKR